MALITVTAYPLSTSVRANVEDDRSAEAIAREGETFLPTTSPSGIPELLGEPAIAPISSQGLGTSTGTGLAKAAPTPTPTPSTAVNIPAVPPNSPAVVSAPAPAPVPTPMPVTKTATGRVLFREVVEKSLLGISFEPETMMRTRERAQKLADLWHRRLSKRDEEEWRMKCASNLDSDDFCPILFGISAQEALASADPAEAKDGDLALDANDNEPAPPSVSSVVSHLLKADLDPLLSASSGSLYSALRRLKKSDEIRAAVEAALAKPDSFHCKNPVISTALAQKLETFFPNPILKEKMYWLFGKTRKCAVSDAGNRAKFRMAIHRVQDTHCDLAAPLLDELYATGDLEFTSRSLYWKARCAKTAGDKLKFSALQQRLLKEAPLSYHSILLNRAEVARLARVLSNDEPSVVMRSMSHPKMNGWIRVVEGLIAIGQVDFAQRVLTRSMSGFLKVEPELKLYLSALAERVKDPIDQFRLVGMIFRERPELISQNTLKLFYPLKNFPIIQSYSADMDPFFVAALIRQESGFNPRAHSRVGAVGLMQLMPATARQLEHVTREALWTPNVNIRLGSRYVRRLVDYYGMDAELALAAYNAGRNVVDLWRKRYPGYDRMAFFDLIPYKETRDYVALISRNYFWYHKLYGDLLGRPVRAGGSMPFMKREVATAAPALIGDPADVPETVLRTQPRKLVFTLFQ